MGELAATKAVNIDELKRVGIIAQNQKDTYLIRLRTVGGDLTADALNTITRVSQKYGRGEVHLTTRQAVEIPSSLSMTSRPHGKSSRRAA